MSDRIESQFRAVIFGCAGPRLTAPERDFFAETKPWGFILFKRNCETPEQVRTLVAELRASIDRQDAPVLVDQEGGRVQRLQPPNWRHAPAAETFGRLADLDLDRAIEACHTNARLLAAELADLDIDVDCIPCLDVRQQTGHDVIGDRAFGTDPTIVAALGRATAEGLLAGGVLPVVKHIPGHGRTRVDSHVTLPVVDAEVGELQQIDFVPFKDLGDLPIAMTGHILYRAIDPIAPATTSAKVVNEVIREHIGFDGLLLSDDISMQALAGNVSARSRAALDAGCDIVLHCNADPKEMIQVATETGMLSDMGATRAARALALRKTPTPFDRNAASARLDALLAPLRAIS